MEVYKDEKKIVFQILYCDQSAMTVIPLFKHVFQIIYCGHSDMTIMYLFKNDFNSYDYWVW